MQVAQQVTGQYCGQQFNGVIESSRRLTVNTDGCFEFVVRLSEKITVFSTERDTLILNTLFDGSPSSYTQYTDSMQ